MIFPQVRPVLLLTATISVPLALSACGSSETTTTIVERVTTVEAAPAADRAPSTNDTTTESVAENEPAPTTPAKNAKKRSSARRSCTKVPNVVGLRNLQVSQDTLQEAGFYVMRQRDASPKDRSQLWDRNWVVVRQSPAPGQCVSLSTTITTWSLKHGE